MLWAEADQLKNDGQLEQAAQRYQALRLEETKWKKRQRAGVLAGHCFEQTGRLLDAVAEYETVVNEADQQLAEGHQGPPMHWLQVALFQKAQACEQTGQQQEALRAIDRLRIEFPKSDYAMRVLDVKARLEGRGELAAERDLAIEQEALQLAEDASDLFKGGNNDDAMALFDRILAHYPDTAAVFPAMRTKALILWGNGRYEEARAAYAAIIERCAPVAPHSQLVRTAEYRIAWQDAHRGLKESIARLHRNQQVDSTEWQRIRDLCSEVIAKDPDPVERADARLLAIQSYIWQRDPERVLSGSLAFLEEYAGPRKLAKFKLQVAHGHLFAAIALSRLSRFDEAMAHIDWMLTPPPGEPADWLGPHLARQAELRRWVILDQSGAPAEDVRRATEEYVSRYPNDSNVAVMLSLAASIEERRAER